MDNQDVKRSRSRSRDRTDEWSRDDQANNAGSRNAGNGRGDGYDQSRRSNQNEGSNVYVTNLSFEITDDTLREAFAPFGEIVSASVVREPVTHISRGFGFVSFANSEDADRAIDNMSGAALDGRTIKAERARRSAGYEKTPGRYLGPPQMSTKFVSRRDRSPPRYAPHGGYDGRGGDSGYYPPARGDYRGYDAPPSHAPRDPYPRDPRDYRESGYGYRGAGDRGGYPNGGGYRDNYPIRDVRDDRYAAPPAAGGSYYYDGPVAVPGPGPDDGRYRDAGAPRGRSSRSGGRGGDSYQYDDHAPPPQRSYSPPPYDSSSRSRY